jgi:hypothetical protein
MRLFPIIYGIIENKRMRLATDQNIFILDLDTDIIDLNTVFVQI